MLINIQNSELQQEMMDIHSEYLKDDHLQEDEDQDINLELQKKFSANREEADEELQNIIMEIIVRSQKKEDSISADLEIKLQNLLGSMVSQNEEQVVRMRMSELALSKILVYTHGKSQFRLVMAHHHMGKAYLNYKCYEQAIDHITLALKKNSKLSDLKQTKLYHSHILTTLSKCYYEISSIEDALEVLNRAEDIQNVSYNEITTYQKCNIETLKIISNCHNKLKNYKKAHEYILKALEYSSQNQGHKTIAHSKLQIEEAKIYFEEKQYDSAISQLDRAIETLLDLNYGNKLELIELQELLAGYYQKNGQIQKQIQTLFAKLQLFAQTYDESHKNTLKLKRSIATILIKNEKLGQAIKLLDQILESQEKIYGLNSIHVGKTLKMLGMVFLSKQNQINSAQHYLKRSIKILLEHGNVKLVKQIRNKLGMIKQMKEKRINGFIKQE